MAPLRQLGWNSLLSKSFELCREAMKTLATRTHRDEAKHLCMYIDASDSHWSEVLTQVPHGDLSLPHPDKRHEQLAFYFSRFSGAQRPLRTLEKEALAELASIERLHLRLACSIDFDLHADYENLIFIIDTSEIMLDLEQDGLQKVLRWAIHLSTYSCVCFHIHEKIMFGRVSSQGRRSQAQFAYWFPSRCY